jgi:uncharacterized protein
MGRGGGQITIGAKCATRCKGNWSNGLNSLIASARRSLKSARLLLDDDDPSSAASRLYFALFSAMRAAIKHRTGIDPRDVKTHHGVFRLFEQHVIAAGLIDPARARIVYRAQELRWGGDYSDPTSVASADVKEALEPAKAFIDRCEDIVGAEEGRT